jgi:hypothetical protein
MGKKHNHALELCESHHTPSYPALVATPGMKMKSKGFEKTCVDQKTESVSASRLFELISAGFSAETNANEAYTQQLKIKIKEFLCLSSSSLASQSESKVESSTLEKIKTPKFASEDNNGVILFYNYTNLLDTAAQLRDWQEELCLALNITGRTRIAQEGINGTLGTHTHMIIYIMCVHICVCFVFACMHAFILYGCHWMKINGILVDWAHCVLLHIDFLLA